MIQDSLPNECDQTVIGPEFERRPLRGSVQVMDILPAIAAVDHLCSPFTIPVLNKTPGEFALNRPTMPEPGVVEYPSHTHWRLP